MNAKPQIEDGYEVVHLRPSWGGVSLLLFALSLPAPYLMHVLPWRPATVWVTPLLWVPVVVVLATLGVLCGLIGYRGTPGNGLARAGLALNGLVLAILLLFAALITLIFWGR